MPATPSRSAPATSRPTDGRRPRAPARVPLSPRATRAGSIGLVLAAALVGVASAGGDTTPAQTLERFVAQAAGPSQPDRGRRFFAERHGGEWSCASCHGADPTAAGRHAVTAKAIDPLAPAANPAAFTDAARIDKWFRRNCRDVLRRECTPSEKADVVAWLLTLRR
jgi:hypothetical protein